jgi:hypothetical protein
MSVWKECLAVGLDIERAMSFETETHLRFVRHLYTACETGVI